MRAAVALVAALALITPRAWAQDGEESDDAAEVEAPPPEQTPLARVAVIVLGKDGEPVPSAMRATLQVSMERALEDDARLEVVDQDEALAIRGGVVPTDRVSEARGLVLAGEELLRRGKAAPALAKLQAASAILPEVLAWAQKQELARAQFLLGAAYAVSGDAKKATAEFVALLAWRTDFVADPEIAPAEVLPLWEKAQAKVGKLPGGSVEITSRPDNAMAYVDGRFVGFTPTIVEALPAAVHYVTVRAHGRVRSVTAVRISEKKAAEVDVELDRSPEAARLDAAVSELAGSVGDEQASAEMQAAYGDLAELLEVQHAVILVAPDKGDTYEAYVYAVEGGTRLATAKVKLGERDPEEAFAELVTELYAQISFEPPPPPESEPELGVRTAKKPFYKKWWFWSAVGAVIVTGVALPLYLGRDTTPELACPPGESCGLVVFDF